MIDVKNKIYYRVLYKNKEIEPFNWDNFMRNLFPKGYVQGTQGTIGEILPCSYFKNESRFKKYKDYWTRL